MSADAKRAVAFLAAKASPRLFRTNYRAPFASRAWPAASGGKTRTRVRILLRKGFSQSVAPMRLSGDSEPLRRPINGISS
jgi:hypothetical protein